MGCPATENSLSHSADIGATVSNSRAILLNFGYLSRLLCQYSYGPITRASESLMSRCHFHSLLLVLPQKRQELGFPSSQLSLDVLQ